MGVSLPPQISHTWAHPHPANFSSWFPFAEFAHSPHLWFSNVLWASLFWDDSPRFFQKGLFGAGWILGPGFDQLFCNLFTSCPPHSHPSPIPNLPHNLQNYVLLIQTPILTFFYSFYSYFPQDLTLSKMNYQFWVKYSKTKKYSFYQTEKGGIQTLPSSLVGSMAKCCVEICKEQLGKLSAFPLPAHRLPNLRYAEDTGSGMLVGSY